MAKLSYPVPRSIKELIRHMRKWRTDPVELFTLSARRIQHFGVLNAIVTLMTDTAEKQAYESRARYRYSKGKGVQFMLCAAAQYSEHEHQMCTT